MFNARAWEKMKPNMHSLYLAACERMKPRGFAPEVIAAFGIVRPIVIAAAVALPAQAQTIQHHDASGNAVQVMVMSEACPTDPSRGCAVTIAGVFYAIYLGGNDRRSKHELAHVAGMKHGPWIKSGFTECAVVTDAGRDTGYAVGQMICGGLDGSDIVEGGK